MQRRHLLGHLGSWTAAAWLHPTTSHAQDRYAPYRGQTVRMSIPTHPHYDAMRKLLPAFTRETGIRVDTDPQPLPEMKRLQLAEMQKDSCDFDLVCYVAMWKGEYVKRGLIRPLAPYLENAAFTPTDFDLKDIVPGYLENIGLVGGWKGYLAGGSAQLYGLPYGAETSILAYRKDLFDAHQIAPPSTYFELERMLPRLREKTGLGALTSRGKAGHQCVHAWLLHLNPIGGKIFENNWAPRFNDASGVRALNLLRQVMETGPAGMQEFDQGAMMNAFLQGQAAMYLDSTIVFGAVRDATKSRVDGKVAYARHPKGSRHSAQSGGLGLAIPQKARNPDAAFLLLQWLTAKAQDKAVAELGGAPQRQSTLADAALLARFPEFSVLRHSINDADPNWRPIIPPWDEINTDVLGAAIHQVLQGKSAAQPALDKAAMAVAAIMRREGYLVGAAHH